jgi:hypothetical protein
LQIRKLSTEYKSVVPGREVRGVILHSTETRRAVAPHRDGSWHYEIGRAGQVLQYIDDDVCAWHVRAPDQKRPPWIVDPPANWRLSAVNYCTLGIELVSHRDQRAAGIAYTDAQYRSLRALCVELEARHGSLFYERHGALQLDRTDPVSLDYARAGFSLQPDGGFLFRPGEGAASAAEENDLNYDKMIKIQARLEQAIQILNRAQLTDADIPLRTTLNHEYAALVAGKTLE